MPDRAVKYLPTWLPGAGFKKQAYEWRKSITAMVEVPFNAVKQAIVSISDSSPSDNTVYTIPFQSDGIASNSMIVSLLSELNEGEDNSHKEHIISGVAAAAYTGESSNSR